MKNNTVLGQICNLNRIESIEFNKIYMIVYIYKYKLKYGLMLKYA